MLSDSRLYWCLPWCLSQCLLIPTDSWDGLSRPGLWLGLCAVPGLLAMVVLVVLEVWLASWSCSGRGSPWCWGSDWQVWCLTPSHYWLCLTYYSPPALINTLSCLPAATTSHPATNRLSEAPAPWWLRSLNTPTLSCLLTRLYWDNYQTMWPRSQSLFIFHINKFGSGLVCIKRGGNLDNWKNHSGI